MGSGILYFARAYVLGTWAPRIFSALYLSGFAWLVISFFFLRAPRNKGMKVSGEWLERTLFTSV